MNHRLKAAILFLLMFIGLNSLAAQEKEWTFLLFLNGKNNLDAFGDMNLNQMEQIGSSDQVSLVVQWGSLRSKSVKRLYIEKDSDVKKVSSPVVADLGPTDMGDYSQLVDFIKWGHDNYPAKKYFVAVWNHGSGWHFMSQLRSLGGMLPQDISYDDETGNQITTEQLGLAMAEASHYVGKKIELYGSDACLMAMAEVAGEMKDSVNYFVGSQDLEPGEGWPYADFLRRLDKDPSIDGRALGKILTEEYLKAYSGGVYGYNDVTLSAFDLNKMTDFENSIADLSKQIQSLSPTDLALVKAAISESVNFYFADYRDLFDFLNLAQKKGARLHLDMVRAGSESFIVSNQVSPNWSRASGVSIWLPKNSNSYENRYENLGFNQRTNWLDALQKIFAKN